MPYLLLYSSNFFNAHILFLIFISSFYFSKAQTNYYVAPPPTGNNSNNGLTTTTPFSTATYAVTQASHGDTINIMAGTYTNPTYGVYQPYKNANAEITLRINNKNSVTGNYLVVRPYQGAAVKLKGDGDFVVQIRNSSYIRIEGLEVEGEVNNVSLDSAFLYQFRYRQCLNASCSSFIDTFRVPYGTPETVIDTMTFPILNNTVRASLYNNIGFLSQASHHIDIIGNNIHHHTGTGLRVFQGDYINLIDNNIHNNSRRSSAGNHGLVIHSALSIDLIDTHKFVVSNNWVHDNYNEVYSWSEIKTFIHPALDEGKGISLQKVTVANGWEHGAILIKNNICDHNGFSGIHINECIRVDVVNNTCYNNNFTRVDANNVGISASGDDSIKFINNISVTIPPAPGSFAMSTVDIVNMTAKNNIVFGNLDPGIDAIDSNTILMDPLFVDTVSFQLQPTSPAINASIPFVSPIVEDYNHMARVSAPDIGAVESPNIVLPLSIVDIKANKLSEQKSIISWETANEENMKKFILEKSKDLHMWTPINIQMAIGNIGANKYYFVDREPETINYYRLKIIDNNAKITYSKTVNLFFDKINVLVSPNPTSNYIYITNYKSSDMKIFSANGALVNNVPKYFIGHKLKLDLSKLPEGNYFIIVDGVTYRVIKE